MAVAAAGDVAYMPFQPEKAVPVGAIRGTSICEKM